MDCFGTMNKINACVISILIFAAVCAFDTSLSFAENESEKLGQARTLVERKAYAEALEIYTQIGDWLRRDPGLVIEWARVYAYADRHPEAIELFEEVRSSYPSRARGILRELAEQYKWDGQLDRSITVYREALHNEPDNMVVLLGLAQALVWGGQHREAIEEYDSILHADPGSIPALLGKAEVLSWRDKLEEASILHKRVLEIDPKNIHALNGVARILVWQGYHRKGARQYKEILKEYPDNLDSLEGLAFAYNWAGDETRALEILDKLFSLEPDREHARNLYYKIKNSRQPYGTSFNRYSHDKNGLRIFTTGARGGIYPWDGAKAEGIYEWLTHSNPDHNDNSPVSGHKGGIGFSQRLGKHVNFDSFLYLTNFDVKDFTPFTTNTWLTIKPSDMWSFYLSYNRETFEDIDSIMNEIVVDSGSVAVDYRPDRWWFFSANYKRGDYNDGNTQDSLLAKTEFRLNQDPYMKVYYNYYFSDWSEQIGHGYFNPFSIQAHTLGIYSSVNLSKKLFIEGQGSVGYEVLNPPEHHPTYFGTLGLSYRLTENWLISARGEYFDARPDSHNLKGYSKKSVFLTATYSFGAEPGKLITATESSRPVTGR